MCSFKCLDNWPHHISLVICFYYSSYTYDPLYMMPSIVHRLMQFKVTQWLRQLERALCHKLASHQCLYKYMDHKGSAAMLPVKKSAGVCIRGESEDPLCVSEEAHNKRSTLVFNPGQNSTEVKGRNIR